MLAIKKNKTLIIIFLLSCFFIFFQLTYHDVVSDEATYGFRAIGYYDHLVSQLQTTPYQWFNQPHWWFKLSFHDAPYLSFLIQHIFFKIFGVSLWVMRLPFALAGIGLILLVYLLFKNNFKIKNAWLAASLLLVNVYHLWSAKLGYLEILASFFVWLSIYFFFRIKDNHKNFYWWGLCLGLACVTKYTAFFIIPVYLIYLVLFERQYFKDKNFYWSCLVALIIFSPVMIYNLAMFFSVGHFDLQFSALFGQPVAAWAQINHSLAGGLGHKLLAIGGSLFSCWGIINFILFILALVFLTIFSLIKKERQIVFFTIMGWVFIFLFAMINAAASRFLSFFNPLWAVVLALTIYSLKLKKMPIYILAILLIGYNLFFSYNTLIKQWSLGQNKVFFSKELLLKNYGYNQLAQELDKIIAVEKPYIKTDLKKGENNVLLVFDANINYFPKMWYIQRLTSYYEVAFASTDELLMDFEDKNTILQTYNKFYFIKAINTFLRPADDLTPTAEVLENNLLDGGVDVYQTVKDSAGQVAFKIYKF